MKFCTIILVFFVGTNTVFASNWKSEELNNELSARPEHYATNVVNEEKISNLFPWVWEIANRTHPIDNRAYLFSLALDLYNSMPAGERWEEGRLVGGKAYFYGQIANGISFVQPRDRDYWQEQVDTGQEWRKEDLFLRRYMKQYADVVSGHIAEPTIEMSALDLQNPTHYEPMQRWMASMATAMANNIPPWEAEEWNRNNGIATFSREGVITPVIDAVTAPVTAATTTRPEPVQQPQPQPEQPKTDPQPDTQPAPTEEPINSMVLWGVLIAVVLGGIGALIWWNRNKKG